MQDVIQRTITINATKETIYHAIAHPDRVVSWFPDHVEGTFRKGEQSLLDFGTDGRSRILIVDAVPCSYFAFRWVPGSGNFEGDVRSVQTTLVEFRIREEATGRCTVIMTESGFASLPSEIASRSYEENAKGWDPMMVRLETCLRTSEAGVS